jgi:ribosomal protein RSM22 (predicted rRNA methylase)
MGGTLQNLVQDRLSPGGIWQLMEPTRSVLRHQISLLPKRSVSEIDARYPVTPASMRAFLEDFFTRHYFQIQNSLVSYTTSPDFLDLASSGHLRILDIGAGPAIAALAIMDLVGCLLECVQTRGGWPTSRVIDVTYVLNDTSAICLAVAQRMLAGHFHRRRGYGTVVVRSRMFSVQTPFPSNMHQIGRIARNVGTYDITILSYVVGPLVEDSGLSTLVNGLLSIEKLCTHNGRILIVQDRFRGALMRRISRAVGISTHREELTQEVYPDRDVGEIRTYWYYDCLYGPRDETATHQGLVA